MVDLFKFVMVNIKVIIINGSPGKKFNTAQMLESAMKGAADGAAGVEMINLIDYEFTDRIEKE